MNIKNRLNFFFPLLSLFFTDSFFFLGHIHGLIVVTTDSYQLYVYSIVSMNVLVLLVAMFSERLVGFYVSLYLSVYFISLIFITRNFLVFLALIPLLASIFYILAINPVNGKMSRIITMVAVLMFMFYMGKIFVLLAQPSPGIITIESLTDKITAVGLTVPMTGQFGLYISTKFADVLLSPVQFFLILIVSSFLVENYHRIFGLFRNGNAEESKKTSHKYGLISSGYAIVATFSCQCESAIALLPAVTLLVVDILELPFLVMSTVFLLLTYFFISRYYSARKLPNFLKGKKKGFKLKTTIYAPLIVTSQLLSVVGISFGLEKSPLFLYGTAMVMMLDGFILVYIFSEFLGHIRIGMRISVLLTFASIIITLLWFYPKITVLAISSPAYFVAMTYLMTLVGLIVGFVYFNSPSYGIILVEIFVVAIGIVPLILYYLAFILGENIWKFWSLSDQIELALVLWIAMIPAMWIATQRSLAEPIIRLSAQESAAT